MWKIILSKLKVTFPSSKVGGSVGEQGQRQQKKPNNGGQLIGRIGSRIKKLYNCKRGDDQLTTGGESREKGNIF
jgi:hypothetical protein